MLRILLTLLNRSIVKKKDGLIFFKQSSDKRTNIQVKCCIAMHLKKLWLICIGSTTFLIQMPA